MKNYVSIRKNGYFTTEHLATLQSNIRLEAFPQYYTNAVFKSLKFDGKFKLIDAELIDRDVYGSAQTVRANSKNDKYDEIKSDILEVGWRLYMKPIFVKRIPGTGRFKILDGRTKDKILNEIKFKNRICAVIDIHEDEELEFGERTNAGEDSPPAGHIKEIDIITLAYKKIESGHLELDQDDIRKWIDKCCGDGKFSGKKRDDIAWKIFHHQVAIQSTSLEPRAWSNNKEVYSWLEGTKYKETSTVVYLPFAASSPMKAVFAAANLSREKPTKEIRVVIYVSKLSGYSLQKSYINSILKFKHMWADYMSLLGDKYFNGAPAIQNHIVLYGCVPSNIEEICENLDELIIFGKNDQKITAHQMTNSTLSSYLEIDEEEENELEEA
jgi:hypothetical protein